MRLSITLKLFLVLLLSTGVVGMSMVAFMTWSFERGFINYVEERKQERTGAFVERLEAYYAEHGSWEALLPDRAEWLRLVFSDEAHDKDNPPRWIDRLMRESIIQPGDDDGQRPRLPIDKRVVLLDADKRLLIGDVADIDALEHYPVRAPGGQIAGYAGIRAGPPLERIVEVRFLEKQTNTFFLIALLTVLLSGLLAIPLARRLVRPLHAFTAGSQALAAGHYETRIPVESSDELGQLARDFNALAAALKRTEAQRRQWVADTSHELRTPLSILRGEIEALQDGLRPFDQQAIDSLHNEIMRLNRLVDDLYELAKSDSGSLSYRPVTTEPAVILRQVLEQHEADFRDKAISTELTVNQGAPHTIHADPDRLAQLFRNLLANSLRYTDDGGRLHITVSGDGRHLLVDFEDSAPGVADDELPHLFERFYRVEASRNRESGGAGLGLAICRNIVDAHGGEIDAAHSELGGLHVHLRLPVLH